MIEHISNLSMGCDEKFVIDTKNVLIDLKLNLIKILDRVK